VSSSALIAAFAIALGIAGGAVAQGPSGPTARDGVFTTAQADRGSEAYVNACAHCHASDLQGDVRKEIPSLAESDFFVRWSNRSLGELFDLVSKDMPADKPGSLSPRQAADILAYVLQVNKFPAGKAELPPDSAQLKPVLIGNP